MTTGHMHQAIWSAIDRISQDNQISPSALAMRAGLDKSAFNRSKRVRSDGRPRWPSTESIALVLACTGQSFDDFARVMREVAA